MIKAVGIVESECIRERKPAESESTNNNWGSDGYLVKLNWRLLKIPFSPKAHIDDIKDFLPSTKW